MESLVSRSRDGVPTAKFAGGNMRQQLAVELSGSGAEQHEGFPVIALEHDQWHAGNVVVF